MVTLGIDASTTTIGWSFFSDKILDCGFIDIKKLETNKEKAFFFVQFIKQNKFFDQCTHIVLEAALSNFLRGFSSQQVLLKLVKWNAILEYVLSEEFPDKKIILESVNTIRKDVFGKCRIKGLKSKEFVKLNLEKKVENLNEYVVYSKNGKIDKRTEDIFDAIVCSMYSVNKLT